MSDLGPTGSSETGAGAWMAQQAHQQHLAAHQQHMLHHEQMRARRGPNGQPQGPTSAAGAVIGVLITLVALVIFGIVGTHMTTDASFGPPTPVVIDETAPDDVPLPAGM